MSSCLPYEYDKAYKNCELSNNSTMPANELLTYSERYEDATYEYRHVILPEKWIKMLPTNHRLTETEWRNLGLQMSTGWVHYLTPKREPHILCFRRPRSETGNLLGIEPLSIGEPSS